MLHLVELSKGKETQENFFLLDLQVTYFSLGSKLDKDDFSSLQIKLSKTVFLKFLKTFATWKIIRKYLPLSYASWTFCRKEKKIQKRE